MPWATVFDNVRLPLKLKGANADNAAERVEAVLDRVGLDVRRLLSAGIIGRHAHARLDRARADHRAAAFADGRAVRRARRDHAVFSSTTICCRCGRRCAPPSSSSPTRCSSRSICRAASRSWRRAPAVYSPSLLSMRPIRETATFAHRPNTPPSVAAHRRRWRRPRRPEAHREDAASCSTPRPAGAGAAHRLAHHRAGDRSYRSGNWRCGSAVFRPMSCLPRS